MTLAEARERRRLATILHDHLQQLLVGAKFSTSILRMKAGKDVQPTVEQLAETLTEAIRAARSLTADLSPPILHEKGLAAGLEWLGRQMHGKHGMAIEVDAQADGEPQAEQVRIFLFEAVRELLLNAAKHAQTDTARVGLRLLDSGEVEVTVADSGAGFDPARLENEMTATGGFGLFSIRERLGYLGGRMTVDSAPGRGSRFTLVAPARLASAPVEAPPKAAETPQAAQATGPAAGPLPDARGRIRVLLA
ncbi:MAG: ATP-binding protein, partial [Planctomycetota bacterium]|nr:ATP-binding protein [Planctomycetota bacterium]